MTHIPFIKGIVTNLVILEKTDVPTIHVWANDSEITQYLQLFLPMSRAAEDSWFESLNKQPNDVVLGIETKDGVLIGTMGLHRIDYRHGTATTGAMLGNKEYIGKNYGTDAKMHLLHWAFTTLNLRKVCSEVLASNPRSKRYLEKTGYREVGCRKKHTFVKGEYVDQYIMEIFKEDFLPLWL